MPSKRNTEHTATMEAVSPALRIFAPALPRCALALVGLWGIIRSQDLLVPLLSSSGSPFPAHCSHLNVTPIPTCHLAAAVRPAPQAARAATVHIGILLALGPARVPGQVDPRAYRGFTCVGLHFESQRKCKKLGVY